MWLTVPIIKCWVIEKDVLTILESFDIYTDEITLGKPETLKK